MKRNMVQLTAEMTRRIQSGINEAMAIISNETKYSEDLRNVKLVNDMNAHISKLKSYLESGLMPSPWVK